MSDFDFISNNGKPIAMIDYTDFFDSYQGYGYLYEGKIVIHIGEKMSKDNIVELFQDSITSILT